MKFVFDMLGRVRKANPWRTRVEFQELSSAVQTRDFAELYNRRSKGRRVPYLIFKGEQRTPTVRFKFVDQLVDAWYESGIWSVQPLPCLPRAACLHPANNN